MAGEKHQIAHLDLLIGDFVHAEFRLDAGIAVDDNAAEQICHRAQAGAINAQRGFAAPTVLCAQVFFCVGGKLAAQRFLVRLAPFVAQRSEIVIPRPGAAAVGQRHLAPALLRDLVRPSEHRAARHGNQRPGLHLGLVHQVGIGLVHHTALAFRKGCGLLVFGQQIVFFRPTGVLIMCADAHKAVFFFQDLYAHSKQCLVRALTFALRFTHQRRNTAHHIGKHRKSPPSFQRN